MTNQIKILYLGDCNSPVMAWLKDEGYSITNYSTILTLKEVAKLGCNWCISYGYKYILNSSIVNFFNGNIINLHISYLPWNRGADPNVWSFVDNTAKGVTIHQIDNGIDTGPIFVQKELFFDLDETLAKSYCKLCFEIEKLFINNWLKIISKEILPIKQIGLGSYHKKKDKDKLKNLLAKYGWLTKICDL